ncbi:hypothetical protein [Micromonospora sp. NPDC048830]|uniref:hypothetical protein n=1 Tax=Micromonospora sp. NPDC048830 TaxID=3364257 RepID=UPI00372453E4
MPGASVEAELVKELDRLYEDCSYSSQTYFEAAKSAEFWGRTLVFGPAAAAALASLLVALGLSKQWGAVGAISAAIAATASFLGSDRRATALRDTARRFTTLRHLIRLERTLAISKTSEELQSSVRALLDQYSSIAAANELASNRFFRKAQDRIRAGVLDYESDGR